MNNKKLIIYSDSLDTVNFLNNNGKFPVKNKLLIATAKKFREQNKDVVINHIKSHSLRSKYNWVADKIARRVVFNSFHTPLKHLPLNTPVRIIPEELLKILPKIKNNANK